MSIAYENIINGNQLTKVNRELRLMGCQVSPLVLRIRDNGPAVLDGECFRDSTLELLEREPANSMTADKNCSWTSLACSAFKQLHRGQGIMIVSALLLAFSLLCVGTYAWKQKNQVVQLEVELTLLKAAEQENP